MEAEPGDIDPETGEQSIAPVRVSAPKPKPRRQPGHRPAQPGAVTRTLTIRRLPEWQVPALPEWAIGGVGDRQIDGVRDWRSLLRFLPFPPGVFPPISECAKTPKWS